MNIDPLSSSGFVPNTSRSGQNGERVTDSSTREDTERLSAELSSNVRESLALLPEIRPEVVERGRQLLADPSYPNQEVVAKIASLITPLPED